MVLLDLPFYRIIPNHGSLALQLVICVNVTKNFKMRIIMEIYLKVKWPTFVNVTGVQRDQREEGFF